MGDMADYIREQEMLACLYEQQLVQCIHCGETRLHWVKADHGYRLANSDNVVHCCDKYERKE